MSLNAGLRMDGLPALDFWDMVFEVLRLTSNTAKQGLQAQGDLCGTGDHSTLMKTMPERQVKSESERLTNCQMWTHIPVKASLSCTYLKTHQDDHQRM